MKFLHFFFGENLAFLAKKITAKFPEKNENFLFIAQANEMRKNDFFFVKNEKFS